MFTRMIFWPWVTGLAILILGLFAARKSISSAKSLGKLAALGPAIYAASLGAFSAEHFAIPQSISAIVPAWLPGRMFWTYFAGAALLAAGLGIALGIYSRLAGILLGVLFLSFVLTIHLPNVMANPKSRFLWAVALREVCFAGGGFALAAARISSLRPLARVLVGVPLMFFAVEHFLHPRFAPGVPLAKITPNWVPIPIFWGYLTGAALLVSGAAMLVNSRHARAANLFLGAIVTGLVLFLYLPIFLTAARPALMEGVNYVFDTMLFAGTVLLAAAIPGGKKKTTLG